MRKISEDVIKINKKKEKNSNRKMPKKTIILLALMLLILTMIFAIHFGSYKVSVREVFNVIKYQLGSGPKPNNKQNIVVWEIRIPRVILSTLVGMALSVSGVVFQGIFRNPLVEPYILGVSSGAAFGAALSIVMASRFLPVKLSAFLFAMLAMVISYSLATDKKETPLIKLILSGIVVSSLFTAMLNYVKLVSADRQLREITFWLMGGFYSADWKNVKVLLPLILGITAIIWRYGWKLNVLTMGDEEARSMGVSVGLLKLLLVILATFITSISVATAGIISWVGLMIPHMSRMTIGPDHRYLIPLSALFGGIFMTVCDTLARNLIMGEIPISIITSVIGTPYLIYLLKKSGQVYFD